MLKGLRDWQKRSEEFGGPITKAEYASINTKHGPMLKVHMTYMGTEEPNYNLLFEGEYRYNNLLPVGKPWIDHPFAPVVERDGRKYTWIYVDGPVDRKLKILLTYDAWFADGYFFTLEDMGGSNKRTMIGSSFDHNPAPYADASNSLLVDGRGWIKVPLWTD